MNLDETQKSKVREWIAAGLQPAEVQERLQQEFGLRMTYMEVRFLLADLDLKPQDKDVPPDPLLKAEAAKSTGPGSKSAGEEEPPQDSNQGKVAITVDQLTRAGALVSGRVTFSDGKKAEWYLDQMGRLGLVPQEKGYKPPQADLMDFQVGLQNELARLGF